MAGSSEATAIADAYADQLKALYKVLLDNMRAHEPTAVQQFTAGLNVAREARVAALRAAGAPVTALARKSRAKAK
jgi:hypothetical protein